ncbi:hypothetical protein AB0454_42445 [Streptomyces sp. NPDC093509]|uniref:hypothetical protein n=1 Tax=Streptomyces sp. NPDC093509 TaxID=3154982 RepID=UPI00344CECFE
MRTNADAGLAAPAPLRIDASRGDWTEIETLWLTGDLRDDDLEDLFIEIIIDDISEGTDGWEFQRKLVLGRAAVTESSSLLELAGAVPVAERECQQAVGERAADAGAVVCRYLRTGLEKALNELLIGREVVVDDSWMMKDPDEDLERPTLHRGTITSWEGKAGSHGLFYESLPKSTSACPYISSQSR